MPPPLVTFKEAKDTIEVLPLLSPCPSASNINELKRTLIKHLESILSEQLSKFGHAGLAENIDKYALKTNTPWQWWPNPGAHQPTHDSSGNLLSGDAIKNNETLYNANKTIYDTQENVRQATIGALNAAAPRKYKQSSKKIGADSYKNTEKP